MNRHVLLSVAFAFVGVFWLAVALLVLLLTG
jgi:hypothetical protein